MSVTIVATSLSRSATRKPEGSPSSVPGPAAGQPPVRTIDRGVAAARIPTPAPQGVPSPLRDARTRLQQAPSGRPDLDKELLQMTIRSEMQALPTTPALALIFALASMFWSPVSHVLLWLGGIAIAKLIHVQNCRAFEAENADTSPRVRMPQAWWRQRFVAVELLAGVAWAGLALVGAGVADASDQVFILVALIVVITMRMTFTAPVLPLFFAGTIPMTVAVVCRLALQNHAFYFAMASMAAGLHAFFIIMAQRLHMTAQTMLEFRAEKDALIAELEAEKSFSDSARAQAEAASVAKSRFLATMSHELRTPLNAILGFSEVMHTELLGPMQNPHYKDYAGTIHDSGRHLLNLINEILDLSRIEAGKYELFEEPMQLADIADDCWRLLKLRAAGKGQTVTFEFPDDARPVWVDARATRQICLNLMSNALKFTPRGGHVKVTVSVAADGAQTLAVKDNGPGIPPTEIDKVLQPFGQGSLAQRTAEGGTGLGLPIVKGLIELHGGTFQLSSTLRQGTTAAVCFPAQRSRPTAPASASASAPAGASAPSQQQPAPPASALPPQRPFQERRRARRLETIAPPPVAALRQARRLATRSG